MLVLVTSTQLLKTNVLCLANWKSKKFDPVARKHVIYKETKLNNPVSSKKKLLVWQVAFLFYDWFGVFCFKRVCKIFLDCFVRGKIKERVSIGITLFYFSDGLIGG